MSRRNLFPADQVGTKSAHLGHNQPTAAPVAVGPDHLEAALGSADLGSISYLMDGLQGTAGNSWVAERIAAASSGGATLDRTSRRKLEKGLGADLSAVRVHTGEEANALSTAMGAKAFTSGSHVFFANGAFDPSSPNGLEVLAHEATHTLQQSDGPVDGTNAGGGISISDPSDRFEQEASQAGKDLAAGRKPQVDTNHDSAEGQAGLAVQRAWWDGQNLENDFWGARTVTEQATGDKKTGDYVGGVFDGASSLAWTGAGLVAGLNPLAGLAVGGLSTAVDLGKAGISYGYGDDKATTKYLNDASLSALGMVPGLGTAIGVGTGIWDGGATIARSAGYDAPLVGDLYHKYLGGENPEEAMTLLGGGPVVGRALNAIRPWAKETGEAFWGQAGKEWDKFTGGGINPVDPTSPYKDSWSDDQETPTGTMEPDWGPIGSGPTTSGGGEGPGWMPEVGLPELDVPSPIAPFVGGGEPQVTGTTEPDWGPIGSGPTTSGGGSGGGGGGSLLDVDSWF